MNQVSFRDPDGFIIESEEKLYRVILAGWSEDLEIIDNDSYKNYSIPVHHKISDSLKEYIFKLVINEGFDPSSVLAIYEVEKLALITYPWEWTPSMLINAGIFTLKMQKELMNSGHSLKDASFFNIQFECNRIIFLDLLSLKRSDNYYPWIPYGQFLRHFVSPSTLLKYGKIDNLKLLWHNIDGIDPLFAGRLIPSHSRLNLYEFFHYSIASHLKKDSLKSGNDSLPANRNSQIKLANLLDWNIRYLEKIKSKLKRKNSYWADYYKRDVSNEYFTRKSEVLRQFLESIPNEGRVLDIGSNIGEYSLIFLEYFNEMICLEKDTVCCEIMNSNLSESMHFENGKKWYVVNADITRPDPDIGWMNRERKSLLSRIKSELVSAMGLIHHIYFSESIDFNQQAELFDFITKEFLLIEFISPEDDKVKIISSSNLSRLADYTRARFLESLSTRFSLINSSSINATREIFLFEKSR